MIDPTPLTDANLSLRARGLYGLFVAHGKVLPASEVYSLVPEGRDAIRTAMNELISAGYITKTRFRTSAGQYAIDYATVSEPVTVNQGLVNRGGFPGDLYRGTDYIANSSKVLIGLNKLSPINTSGKPEIEEEYVIMPWPGLDEPEQPKVKRQRIDDSDSGAVGKIDDPVDKRELRKAKYKKAQFAAVPETMLRKEKPEESWSTPDLVAEFYDLFKELDDYAPSQVNAKSLASWINKMVGDGVARNALLRAMRAFFSDPRLTREVGIGQPMWRRFIAYYPTVHGIYSKDVEVEYEDDAFLAHQAKMLKLLED